MLQRSIERLMAVATAALLVTGITCFNRQRQPGEGTTMLMLTGDVMLGRGIDQILRHSVDPTIYESYMRSAAGYVDLAEEKNGPIPRKVRPDYVWGDALVVLRRYNPRVRIIY